MLARLARETRAAAAAACASTWAWRRAWARRSGCSRRRHRRHERGTDIVVGFVEAHGRPRTAELLDGLEVVPAPARRVPRRRRRGDGRRRRHRPPPDGRARRRAGPHQRARAPPREKRWQDVELIRDAGIDVVSTLQRPAPGVGRRRRGDDHRARRSTSACPTTSSWTADEIELVDMSPHALRQRMRHGNVYPPERPPRPRPLLHRAQPHRAARAVPAVRRPRGRRAAGGHRLRQGMGRLPPVSERVLVLVDGSP